MSEETIIVERLRKKLLEINIQIEEVYELQSDWKPKEDWHSAINKLRTKQYLLEDILNG